jgi:hypothetical protein
LFGVLRIYLDIWGLDVNRRILETNLEQAKRHVAMGEGDIARQCRVIEELERDGHDTKLARELLQTFENLQAMHVADVARLTAQLAALPGKPSQMAHEGP